MQLQTNTGPLLTFVVFTLFPETHDQPVRSGRTLHSSPSRHGFILHHHFCRTMEAGGGKRNSTPEGHVLDKRTSKKMTCLEKASQSNVTLLCSLNASVLVDSRETSSTLTCNICMSCGNISVWESWKRVLVILPSTQEGRALVVPATCPGKQEHLTVWERSSILFLLQQRWAATTSQVPVLSCDDPVKGV